LCITNKGRTNKYTLPIKDEQINIADKATTLKFNFTFIKKALYLLGISKQFSFKVENKSKSCKYIV